MEQYLNCSPIAELLRECGYWKAMYLHSIGEGPECDPQEWCADLYTPFTDEGSPMIARVVSDRLPIPAPERRIYEET